MRAVVIGAGKVGYSIAQMLSGEGHDVTVIEKDEERLKVVQDQLDVQTYLGSGASAQVLEDAGASQSDMIMAVTEFDELNIVACLTAKQLGIKKTVARVRNPEYIGAEQASNSFLGIDLIINPERVTALAISKLIEVPEAINVDYYADGKVQLLELKVTAEFTIANKMLKDLKIEYPFLIVAILRNGEIIIPRGEDKVVAGDLIFVLAKTIDMTKIEKIIGTRRAFIDNVVILGGGRVGYYLAKTLESRKRQLKSIKIVEKDIGKCESLSRSLDKTLILNGDGTDTEFLKDEHISTADLFVAVTSDDKVNLLVSLIAKNLGVNKTICQVRRSDFAPLVEQVGIDVAVTPRILTAAAILKYIRRGKIVSITLLAGDKAEVIELIVPDYCSNLNIPLKKIKFPKGAILGAILRNETAIIPTGEDHIEAGDQVMVFALPEAVKNVEKFFDKKRLF
ncbi:MAG: Trk system potassium transporter TrkA [Bacillota bacterium]|nr:Trk system potassium transporter TrkA [Bacillota bacterium]